MDQHQLQMMLMALGTFGSFALIYAWAEWRLGKNGSSVFGYLRDHLQSESAVWILIGVIILSIVEGVVAAGIIPKEEEFLNPVTRLAAHVVASVMSVVIAIQIAPQIWNFLEWRSIYRDPTSYAKAYKTTSETYTQKELDKIKAKAKTTMYFILFPFMPLLIMGTLVIPFFNLLIIGVGLGKVDYIFYAFYEMVNWCIPFVDIFNLDGAYTLILEDQGLSPEQIEYALPRFSVFREAGLGVVGMSSFGLYIIHVLLSLIKGCIITLDFQRKEVNQLFKVVESVTHSGMGAKSAKREAFKRSKDAVSAIIAAVDFFRPVGVDFKQVKDEAERNFVSMPNGTAKLKLSNELAAINNDITEFYKFSNARSKSNRELADMENDINNKIQLIFSNSVDNGGLGVPLLGQGD